VTAASGDSISRKSRRFSSQLIFEDYADARAASAEELAEALYLDRTKPELCERVAGLLTLKFLHFVDIRVYGLTTPALSTRYILEPRDRPLALTAAVRANDGDKIALLEHDSAP